MNGSAASMKTPPFVLQAMQEALKSTRIFRHRDLTGLGLARPQIMMLVDDNVLATWNEEHGLYVDPDAETENGFREAVACMLNDNGVIWGKHAAKLHNLVADFGDTVQMLVPYATSLKPRLWLQVRRVREVKMLEVGVEELPNDLGVPIRITSKARTVVDLFRFFRGAESGNDDRFAKEALRSYVGRDGDEGELIRVAKQFDPRTADLLDELISEMHQYMDAPRP